VLVHSLDYRLLYNLSVALGRLIAEGDHWYSQACETLALLGSILEGPAPAQVFLKKRMRKRKRGY
jgi:hypothetical protein